MTIEVKTGKVEGSLLGPKIVYKVRGNFVQILKMRPYDMYILYLYLITLSKLVSVLFSYSHKILE